MDTPNPSKKITVSEFWSQYGFQPYELDNGQVIEAIHVPFRYSIVGLRMETTLRNHAEANDAGEVVESHNGFRLGKYTIRSPRTAFISKYKWQNIQYPYSYLPFAPDIAVEVIAPQHKNTDIRNLAAQYIRAGTRYMWFIYPDTQTVVVYCRERAPQPLTLGDTLRGEDVLPEFAMPVDDIIPKRKTFRP